MTDYLLFIFSFKNYPCAIIAYAGTRHFLTALTKRCNVSASAEEEVLLLGKIQLTMEESQC